MTTSATRVAPTTVQEAIESRHSVRLYAPTPIPRDLLREVLRLASLAPSGRNLQPWRFIVVQDQALKDQLRAAAHDQRQVGEAPAVIALVADIDSTLDRLDEIVHPGLDPAVRQKTIDGIRATFAGMTDRQKADWAVSECMTAMGYVTLAARGFGLDTVPMQGFNQERVRELLGLSGAQHVAVLLPIGYAAQPGFSSHRLPVDTITSFR